MEHLNYDTILDYLEASPQDSNGFLYKELLSREVPEGWQYLGTLRDEKLKPAVETYKLFTHYAIGFYPFSGCDIYQDEQGNVLFSYLEFGGHAPFRTSYIATKSSPFIPEPVAFNVIVQEKDTDDFIEYLVRYGITKDSLEADLLTFKNLPHISDDISGERVVVIRRHPGIISN
jgi:hypothetical protein